MQKKSFVRGTLILSAAALITRTLGFINGIILARFLGAEGIGLLRMAHPLLPLVITLTELGLPVAISKLVSEANAQGDNVKVKRILIVSLIVTGTLSLLLTTLSLFGSKMIAAVFLPDQRAYYAMLAITPIAPIIAISAVLKGYFRGKQDMKPIALSDIIEHTIQIASIMVLVQWLLPYGVNYAAAGAMISSIIGEAAGLLYIVVSFRWQSSANGLSEKLPYRQIHGKRTFVELFRIGLPTTGNGFFSSVYHAFLPKLVIYSLVIYGLGTEAATKQFGILTGYVFPLLFLPTFITHSLSTALIPAISEAKANEDNRLMHRRMEQAMRIALFVGAPCTVILYLWAVPLATVVYHSPEAGELLKGLAPIFFFHYFQSPLYSILLGLGRAAAAMWNFFLSHLFEGVAIWVLGTNLGIHGVALAVGFGVCFLTILNMLSVSSSIGFYFDIRDAVRAACSVAIMVVCGRGAFLFMQQTYHSQPWSVTAAICISVVSYLMALRVTSMIKTIRIKPTLFLK